MKQKIHQTTTTTTTTKNEKAKNNNNNNNNIFSAKHLHTRIHNIDIYLINTFYFSLNCMSKKL